MVCTTPSPTPPLSATCCRTQRRGTPPGRHPGSDSRQLPVVKWLAVISGEMALAAISGEMALAVISGEMALAVISGEMALAVIRNGWHSIITQWKWLAAISEW